MDNDRFLRYQGAIPVALLTKADVAVVGCGAVGRNVIRQLATMGCGSILAIDFDKVSGENMGCQGWAPAEIGQTKVDALKTMVRFINPDCALFAEANRFEHAMLETVDYVFCCVDNMDVRRQVFEHGQHKRLFVEARMGMEVAKVFYVSPGEKLSARYWTSQWFPQSEGEPEKCSERSTIYGADVAAALMVAGFVRNLRAFPNPLMTESNLTAGLGYSVWPEDAMIPKKSPLEMGAEKRGVSAGHHCEYRPCHKYKYKMGNIPNGETTWGHNAHGGLFCSPECAAKQIAAHYNNPSTIEGWVDAGFSEDGTDPDFPQYGQIFSPEDYTDGGDPGPDDDGEETDWGTCDECGNGIPTEDLAYSDDNHNEYFCCETCMKAWLDMQPKPAEIENT